MSETSAQTLLSVRSVSKSFGKRPVLRNLSLEIARGEFLTILGESGSGKTTLLRLIAGFAGFDGQGEGQGEIWLDGVRIDRLPPYQRPVNTVFQQYALFPHLSVFENIAYGLRVKRRGVARTSESEITQRVHEALELVRMSDFLGSAPMQLSGGQQQRIALARALINRPKLLLLDEPLSALDANLRHQMQAELSSLHKKLGITFIFVTHDQQEAMALSDRIALLRSGVLEQVGSPQEIYLKPATTYAAEFIGQTNLVRPTLSGDISKWGNLQWEGGGANVGAVYSLRPERIRLAGSELGKDGGVSFKGRVVGQTFEGATVQLNIECGGPEYPLRARVSSDGQSFLGEHTFQFLVQDLTPLRDSEIGHAT